jgi:transposase
VLGCSIHEHSFASRCFVESDSTAAAALTAQTEGSFWGLQTGPNPTDRAKLGSKRHLICDGRGVPLAIQLTGANRNHSQQALALVDAIPKRNTKHGSWLGRWRWVVERTFAWLNQFRRLRVRYEKRADIHEAFLSLGCALICWRFLQVDLVAR